MGEIDPEHQQRQRRAITHGSAGQRANQPAHASVQAIHPRLRDTKLRAAGHARDDKASVLAMEESERGTATISDAATSAEPIRDHEPALVGDPSVVAAMILLAAVPLL